MAVDTERREIQRDELSAFFEELRLCPLSLREVAGDVRNGQEEFAFSRYALVYLLEGGLELYRKDVCYSAARGDVLLFHPFSFYRARRLGQGELRCICLTFDVGPHHLRREFARLTTDVRPVFHPGSSCIGELLRQTLSRRGQRLEGYFRTVRNVLEQVLLELTGECWAVRLPERAACTPQQKGIIQRSADYVTAHLGQPIRVRDIAAELQISESRLNKTFNDVLGLPPSKYFMNMKMRRAEELMCTTDKTVDEISVLLGFSSAFHLSRVYKETFGISPTKARKRSRCQAG